MLQIMQSVGIVGERIDERRVGLRHEEHVALVDRLPAADAGAVEAQAVFEDVFVELVDGDREVLPDAGEIHEPQVDGLDVVLATHRQNCLWSHSHVFPFQEAQRRNETRSRLSVAEHANRDERSRCADRRDCVEVHAPFRAVRQRDQQPIYEAPLMALAVDPKKRPSPAEESGCGDRP